MAYCYRVDLTRRVASPDFGPDAWHADTARKEFNFGKGKDFSTGKAAYEAALEFAKSMLDQASEVSVWRLSGGCGYGEYLKRDPDSRFSVGFHPYTTVPM